MKTTNSLWACIIGVFFLAGMLWAQDQLADTSGDSGAAKNATDAAPAEEKSAKEANNRVFGKSTEESFKGKVVVIKVGRDDLVNKQAFNFWRRILKRVNDENAKAVVFDINTPGGYAFDTANLIMNGMRDLKVPSYAFVNREASSAGALIAAGTDHIYMYPGSTIGSAELVTGGGQDVEGGMKRKLNSFFDATVRVVARGKGHNPDVIRAMMFEAEEFDFGVIKVEEGELLNLTDDEAISMFKGKPLLAKGNAKSIQDLLEQEGIHDAPVVVATPSGMEKFAYWVAGVSWLLILVGIGGAYFEMKTPGFGIGGVLSLCAFALFFFGNYAAGNMAGYGLMLLFGVGVLLVIVELLVVPGTFIAGISGAVLILGSLLMAMVDDLAFDDNTVRGWDAEQAWDFVARPTLNLAIGLVGAIALSLVMMRYLPDIPLFNKMVMSGSLVTGDASETSGSEGIHLGLQGVTVTDLRPAGKGEFDGKVLDITAANGFITEGTDVKITSEDGLRTLVEEV
ncbi:MAG: nodulation protein NfeD [Akkermansiaceae bacterium]